MASRAKWLLVLGTLAVTAGALAACSSNGDQPASSGDGTLIPLSASGGCDSRNPTEGCACTVGSGTTSCSAVHSVVDGQTLCSVGVMKCENGVYGACESERIVTRSVQSLHTEGYGDAGTCADPCTLYCLTTVDTPTGLTLPAGLNNTNDAGLTLTATPPPANTCTGLTITPSASPASDITVTSSTVPATKTYTSTLIPVGCNPSAPSPLWYTDKYDVAQMDPTTPGKLTVAVPIAGPINIGASLGNFTATAPANIIVNISEASTAQTPPVGSGLINFIATLLSDPIDTNLEILYPYQDTMFPLGLTAPLLQWRNAGQTATGGVLVTLQYPSIGTPIFSISQLITESTTAPVPLRAAQPRYQFPQVQWQAFEQTINRNRATLGDMGRIIIRRRIGTTNYQPKWVDVHSAPGQLKGRVYYNSYGTALVNNYSGAQQSTGGAFPSGGFGAATLVIPPGGTAPTVAAGFSGSGGCFVCHSASADGSTIITADQNYVARKYTFPGSLPNGGTAYSSNAALVFAGINATSTRVMSSSGAFSGDSTSRLYDINGNLISGSNLPTTLKAGYPTFSPDGTKVAFTFRGGSASPLAANTADGNTLSMMTFDGNKTFSAFRNLATPLLGPTVWPAFMPAGDGVIYQIETRSSLDGGYGYTRHDCECGGSYSGATGELWWTSTGAIPLSARLSRLNGYDVTGLLPALPVTPATGHAGYLGTPGPGGAAFYEQRYNYEPTVLPQTVGGFSWVIFTSRRAYGNVATISPYASDPRYDNISIDPTPKKLWIAAINGTATPGLDPSWPAFYLPGQELIAGNSRGVFALDACHPAVVTTATDANLCDSDLDCCGAPTTASCVLDPPPLASPPVKHCVSTSSSTCRAVGQSCTATSNCCNAVAGGVCAGGVCATPPAYYLDSTYTRDYSASCLPGFYVRWGLFDWQSKTPGNSNIQFSAQVSSDGVSFTPATPVLFATASGADVVSPNWATSGTPVSTTLGESAKGTATDRKLRITMALHATTDRGSAPTLIDWRQSIQCIPNE